MFFNRPMRHTTQSTYICGNIRKAGCPSVAVVCLTLLFSILGHAQGGVPLVTVATDQSLLSLSNQFGVPAGTAINQAGDFAFVGNGNSALFLRAAGATSTTRILQTGDPAPGFPGSQIQSFSSTVGINATRSLLFEISFGLTDGAYHVVLLIYDGTNYHSVVSSDDIAPGSGGVTYGTNLSVGGINDNGDISFSAIPTGKTARTFYIVPSGAAAVRVAATDDVPPAACTWCSTPGGTPSLTTFITPNPPGVNAAGQVLISFAGGLFIGSKDGLSLVPIASSGACGPPAATTPGLVIGGISSVLVSSLGANVALNNAGVVAFTDTTASGSAICVVSAGGGPPAPIASFGDAAPTSIGGGTFSYVALWAMNDSGDILFLAGVSKGATTFALMRYHQSSGQTDLVGYNGEPAPGTNGDSFASPSALFPPGITVPLSAFSAVSMANDGRVSFHVLLAQGGKAIYQQTGANAPILLALDGQAAPFSGSGTFNLGLTAVTQTLSSGATFFPSYLTNGSADFAEFLGTPGNVQTLMSTADALPSGARTTFVVAPPRASGRFVVFVAQPAGGRSNLMESDLSSGTITRIVSDGQIAVPSTGGLPSATSVSSNFFVNENGQVAFENLTGNLPLLPGSGVISFGSSNANVAWSSLATPRCGAVYLWSPSTGLLKVAAPGDPATIPGTTFSCVSLNPGPPSPLNKNGQVAFSAWFSGATSGNGVFSYSPGGAISEIVATNEMLPGETQATTLVPSISLAENSLGQTAFGAQVGTPASGFLSSSSGFQGFFLRKVGDAPQEIVANGAAVPGASAAFGAPHYISGLDDNGDLAFTAAVGTAVDGIFFAPAIGNIQTVALDGGVVPGTSGMFSLTTPLPSLPSGSPLGSFLIGFNSFGEIALMNGESDIALRAGITSGTADSGYFRLLRSGPTPGVLQPIVLQGQAAPGGGTFNTIPAPNSLGPYFSLGPDGKLAFWNAFTSGGVSETGIFVARQDGRLLRVLASGDTAPGGGTVYGLSMSPGLAAGDSGKFAFLAGITGGNVRGALFVTAIPSGTAATTTALGPLQDSAVFGQTITLTASVSSAASGTSTGSVSFFDKGVLLSTVTLANGQAALPISTLAAGSHSFIAQYSGDANFASSTSSAIPETISARTTSTALASSLNPAVRGQSVTFTATVTTSAGGAPTGSVTFLDNGASIGTDTLNGSAVATLTTSALNVGTHPITVSYAGDTNSAVSTSSATNETVNVAGFAPPPANLIVAAGQSLPISLTLYAAPGSNLTFTLSCVGLPASASCLFATNPVTPGSPPNGTTVNLIFSTAAGSKMIPAEPGKTPMPLGVFGLAAMIMFAILAASTMGVRRGLRHRLALGMCFAVFVLALAMIGCGATGIAGTPKGLAAFSVIGASGTTTVTTVVSVTVH